MTSGVRLRRAIGSPPRRLRTAAVSIVVRGHSALKATLPANSCAMPITHVLIATFDSV